MAFGTLKTDLHLALDVLFREGDYHLRRSHAPAMTIILRRATLNHDAHASTEFQTGLVHRTTTEQDRV